MCDKTANTYYSPIQFVPDYYKTQEMCEKAGNTCLFLVLFCP